MISEIIISPDCFEDENKLLPIKCILNDVLNYPIYIIDFEKVNWINFIRREYLRNYSNGYRDILGLLTRVDKKNKFFKRCNYDIDISSNTDWLKVSKLSYEEFGCDVVFVGETMISQYKKELPYISNNINEFIEKIDDWNKIKFTNTQIKKTPEDYERAFGKVLKNSDELTIIDPYIGLTKSDGELNWSDSLVLDLFSRLLAINKDVKSKIIIHTKIDKLLDLSYNQFIMDDNKREEDIKNLYEREEIVKKRDKWVLRLESLSKKYGHSYEVNFWADKQYNKTFHDRYLFTKSLQVHSGHSFSALDDSSQLTRWNVLNSIEYENEKLNYKENDALFISVSRPIIIPYTEDNK